MNPFELFSFAKLFSTVMNGQMSVSSAELEAACKLLKEMADSNQCMTSEQKKPTNSWWIVLRKQRKGNSKRAIYGI